MCPGSPRPGVGPTELRRRCMSRRRPRPGDLPNYAIGLSALWTAVFRINAHRDCLYLLSDCPD